MAITDPLSNASRWPYRIALALACATFPLIWIGGLVTTYDAGMAVPDWPSTYGYNLFLYPLSTWLAGPWDLFIEHGHRLFAATVGLITIGLVIATWRCDSRRWLRWWVIGCLVLVLFQGALGGARVKMDEVLLARIHGCVAPLFFTATVLTGLFFSPWWNRVAQHATGGGSNRERRRLPSQVNRTAWLLAVLSYLQLVLGAHLRHISPDWPPNTFRTIAIFHLAGAVVVSAHVFWLTILLRRTASAVPAVARTAVLLSLLVIGQIVLGVATWTVRYGWPIWLPQWQWASGWTVEAESLAQALIATAHVVVGALLVAFSALVAAQVARIGYLADRSTLIDNASENTPASALQLSVRSKLTERPKTVSLAGDFIG